MIRIGVTGHRKMTHPTSMIGLLVEQELTKIALQSGIEYVNTGMAYGFDMLCADACYDLGIPYRAILPYSSQSERWKSEKAKSRYQFLLKHALEVVFPFGEEFAMWKLMKRDEVIVDDSQLIIAYWGGGSEGGTAHTVGYAKSKGIDGVNVYPGVSWT